MKNRLSLHITRDTTLSPEGLNDDDDKDDAVVDGFQEYLNGSNLPAFESRHVSSSAYVSQGNTENVFETPPGTPREHELSENVFGTPTNSTPSSTAASVIDFDASTPNLLHRPSLSLSLPGSELSIPVADGGGWGSEYEANNYDRPLTATPSLSRMSSSSGLHRSNTTNTHTTTNSSTLYSIPSHMSQISSPPSPLHSIASVRPQFDYAGHQQTLSLNGSELDEVGPFGDGYAVPVANGFAPYNLHRSTSRVNSVISGLPPPYTQYPDRIPKPENEDSGDLGVAGSRSVMPNSGALGIAMADRGGEAWGSGYQVMEQNATHPNAVAENETSGAAKEWRNKEFSGHRRWTVLLGALLALLVGLGIGLGVGLGIGMQKASNPGHISTTLSMVSATGVNPLPEETAQPRSDAEIIYPKIPSGTAVLAPLNLKYSNNKCILHSNQSVPDFFSSGATRLWSCNISKQMPLIWDMLDWPPELIGSEITKLGSVPVPLQSSDYEGAFWGGYIVSSQEGEFDQLKDIVYVDTNGNPIQYSVSGGFMEGMQGPSFYRQPFSLSNITYLGDDTHPANDTHSANNYTAHNNHTTSVPTQTAISYKFGVLYNKTVILRDTNMNNIFNDLLQPGNPSNIPKGSGTKLQGGEIVWMCTWDKTLLEVELMVDQYSENATDPVSNSTGKSQGSNSEPQPSTVTVGDLSTPFPAPGEISQSSSDSPYPKYVTPTDQNGNEELGYASDYVRRQTLKQVNEPRSYPQKIVIKEYRPNARRLREILGIDLTDSDELSLAGKGKIRCKKMIVRADGGLRKYKSTLGYDEDVAIEFDEISDAPYQRGHKNVYDAPCHCVWET